MEVGIDVPLPSSVKVRVRDSVFVIAVDYAWKPKKCSCCWIFGHSDNTCPVAPKEILVPKSDPLVRVSPASSVDRATVYVNNFAAFICSRA